EAARGEDMREGPRKPTLDEMGPGPDKESKPYRPGPRSTTGRPGMRGGWRPRGRGRANGSASPAGRSASKTRVGALITRGSINLRMNSFAKEMDCRVKPGNDGRSNMRSVAANGA